MTPAQITECVNEFVYVMSTVNVATDQLADAFEAAIPSLRKPYQNPEDNAAERKT